MSTRENGSGESNSVVCPESTIESANQRNNIQTTLQSSELGSKTKKNLVCESTIESSPRRSFIRKAALATAAVGIGSLALGSVVGKGPLNIPTSSASGCEGNLVEACNLVARNNIFARNTLWVDCAGLNPGNINEYFACGFCCPNAHAIIFGSPIISACFPFTPGEAIASAQVSGSPNRLGLDFYTNFAKRLSITNGGNVGIGTCSPQCGKLEVIQPTSSPLNAIYGETDAPGSCFIGPVAVRGIAKGKSGPTWGGLFSADCSSLGIGVEGGSSSGVGVSGIASAAGGISIEGLAGAPGVIPIVARGTFNQTANLQQWQSGSTPLSVVNKNGWIGIGTASPVTPLQVIGTANATRIGIGTITPMTALQVVGTTNTTNLGVGVGVTAPKTTLQVNGSVSAKVAIKTGGYVMTTSDFAILANAASTALTITLPSASNIGMIVHIKKIDSNTSHIVTVSRGGTDTIEGKATMPLSKQYQSLTLIAGGNGVWYIQSSAT